MTLAPDNPMVSQRLLHYLRISSDELTARVDRMFAWLLAFEWLGLMLAAWIISPRTWNGNQSAIHPHLLVAVLAGPAFICPAIALALICPGRAFTRHAIAVAQMLVSVVLIDVTGGRIEAHFHIFGSLAFLALYRDWRVLITASAVTALDHVTRGILLPQSVYGVLTVSPWRSVEHAGWVIFEDIFLIFGGQKSLCEMRAVALSKAQLYAGAYHDVLTGLANRRMLQENFDSLAKDGETRAVLFVDLDRFKQANDTLGHTVGDKLLATLAARLAKVVKGSDTLARIGGDEFVVLLSRVSKTEDASMVGLRLLNALTDPFVIDGHELLLSASIGISLYPEHGTDLATLQQNADKAMYIAKSRGRNQCAVFSAQIAKEENCLQEITHDVHTALERAEFSLHFQPLVQRDAQLTGFEALLRWNHPVHGFIAPSGFIPLAERSGAIVAIGDWVLTEACRNCAEWQRGAIRPMGVAVNITAAQFEQADFADKVVAVLRNSQLDASLLTLELTESILLQNLPRARQQLAGLRNAGVRIALDDFGTGYSSISYLTTVPADTIKLDRHFVNGEFANTAAVLQSVVDTAHRIGLRVAGKCVETSAQNSRLVDMECDELQGFYFSPPLAPEAVGRYIETHEPEPAELTLA